MMKMAKATTMMYRGEEPLRQGPNGSHRMTNVVWKVARQ